MDNVVDKRRASRLSVVFLVFAFLAPASLGAHDFGVLLNQRFGLDGTGDNTNAEYEAALVPRLSILLGDFDDLFFSASIKTVYDNRGWTFVPELLRNEFTRSFGDTDFHLGRMTYGDPMNIVAAGLFDGVRLLRHTDMGTFGAGVWYTGLLYGGRAMISMNEYDAGQPAFDWDDFGGTYFASRRLVIGLDWEHPSFAELLRVNAALIGQFDLNRGRSVPGGDGNRSGLYHSQYLVAAAAMPFRRFVFELGGAIEVSQTVTVAADNGNGENGSVFNIALAGDVGVRWMSPTPFHDMLSFTGRFTSGRADNDGAMSAFIPITALPHGDVLRAEIPGLSVLSLNYTARLHQTFSAGLTLSCFVRSDLGTFAAWPVDVAGDDGHFLGTEIFARFVWSPVSDVNLNLGAGAFMPALENADTRLRVELSVVLALY